MLLPANRLPLLGLALAFASSALALPQPAAQTPVPLVKRELPVAKAKAKSLSASRESASKAAKSLASKRASLSRSRSARDATSSRRAASKTASREKAEASKAKASKSRSLSLSKASASKSKSKAEASKSKSKSKSKVTASKTASTSTAPTATATASSCFLFDDVDAHVANYTWGLSSTDVNTCSVACESGVAYVGLHGEDCFCLDLDAASFAELSRKSLPDKACEATNSTTADYVTVESSTITFSGNICDATEEGPLLGPAGCESNCFPASQVAAASVPYTVSLPSTSTYDSAPLLCQYACGERELYQYFGLTETFECYCLGTIGAGPSGTAKYNVSEFGVPAKYSACDGAEGFGSVDGSFISLYATDYMFV